MIKNISAITASSFLSMLFLGVAATLIGAAARNIGLTPNEIGLMITFQILGFMISVLISSALADYHEKLRNPLNWQFYSLCGLSFFLSDSNL